MFSLHMVYRPLFKQLQACTVLCGIGNY